MNVGTYFPKHPSTKFVVQNIAPGNKRIKVFQYPIVNGATRDLLTIPGISEADIRHSLLKGELLIKIQNREIVIVDSDIDLLQFNEDQKAFLQSAGVSYGHEIDVAVLSNDLSTAFQLKQDVDLIGVIDSSNLIFTIPSGKFIFTNNYRITVYLNGVRQRFTENYLIAESEGPGTGYDLIIFVEDAPDVGDAIAADYYQAS